MRFEKDKFIFLPIGGTDQIGLNLYLYHYNGKWLIVDFGLGFANGQVPGVEVLVPDLSYIETIKRNIVGMIITHAHEDHIGALQYLWSEIGDIPLYTTRFTKAVIGAKLSENGFTNYDATMHQVDIDGKISIGPFDVEFVSMNHSVPETHGLIITTEKGSVFHTADWKFDANPIIGSPTNKEKLKKIGDKGILAMVCDSTNIFNEGESGSEGELQKSLEKLIKSLKGKLVVTTIFASNVARLHALMEAAKKSKRKVMFAGSSIWRMYHAAIDCGYLKEFDEPLKTKQFSKHDRESLLIIATGCQGEKFAAVTKFARDDHPDIRLKRDDVVVFASKIIPGNEMKIFDVFNTFCKKGIEVLTEKDHFVHVSGHPSKSEMKELYKLIRPKYAIPMHGEPIHIHEHFNFIKEHKLGIPIQVENGLAVSIDQDNTKTIQHIPASFMAVDGNQIVPIDSEIFKFRRRMQESGIMVITIVNDNRNSLLKTPQILAPGIFDSNLDAALFEALREEIMEVLSNMDMRSEKDVEFRIKKLCKAFCKKNCGKEPYVIIQHFVIKSKK